MAGMWLWVTKKLLKWEKAKNIPFHSKQIVSTFLLRGKFFDSIRAEVSPLRSIWYRCYNLCLITCNRTHLLISLGRDLKYFLTLNYFTNLTSFKQIRSYIENTRIKTLLLSCGRHDKSDVFVFFVSVLKIKFV